MGAYNYPAPNSNYLALYGWNGLGIPPIDDPLSDFYRWWNLLNLNPYSAGTAGIDLFGPARGQGMEYPHGGTIMDDINQAAWAAAAAAAASQSGGGGGSSGESQTTTNTSNETQTQESSEEKSKESTQPSQGGSNVGTSVILPGQGAGNTWGLPTSGSIDWNKILAGLGTTGGAMALAALLSGGLGGQTISPYTQTPMYPALQKSFGDWLLGQFKTNEQGETTGVSGATPYTGQINVDLSQTILPGVFGSWTPNNSAAQSLTNLLQLAQPNQMSEMWQNMVNWGGLPGQTTDIMRQFSNAGVGYGIGSRSLANIFDYGAPSASSAGMATASKLGYSSKESGQPLMNRAYGVSGTPAETYLARFLSMSPQAAAYSIPGIQYQPVGRKV